MVYFIDTNIFIRTVIADDKTKHEHCISLLEKVKKNKPKAVTGSIVLAEIVWTLISYYKVSKKQAIRIVKSIVNLNGLRIIDNYQHFDALKLYDKYNIKYIDCLISSYPQIQEKKWCLISYDSDFNKLPILKKTPEEVI